MSEESPFDFAKKTLVEGFMRLYREFAPLLDPPETVSDPEPETPPAEDLLDRQVEYGERYLLRFTDYRLRGADPYEYIVARTAGSGSLVLLQISGGREFSAWYALSAGRLPSAGYSATWERL